MERNSTSNITEVLRPAIFSQQLNTFITVLLVFISIVGIIANSCVIFVIISMKQLHTPLNYLLLNLSIADLIGSFGIYPFVFVDVSRTSIRGGMADFMCVLSTGLMIFFVCSGESVLTLCAISFTRYIMIKFPLKNSWKLTKKGCAYFIFISWLLSIVLLIPNAMTLRYETDTGYCYRYNNPNINMQAYSFITTIFGTILPLTIMGLTYIVSWRQLWRKNQVNCGTLTSERLKLRKKLMKMLGILIASYVVCWSPFYVYWTMVKLFKYFPNTPDGRIKIFRFYTVSVIFGLCNSVLDPIIYTLRGERFKAAVKTIFITRSQVSDIFVVPNAGKA